MKKLTKAALLAAATTFMLAGVTACFTSVNDAGETANGTNIGGNTNVGGGGLTGTWTALDYKPTDGPTSNDGSGRTIDADTKLGAVTVKGTGAQWKPNNSGNPTSWSYLETGKTSNGCLEFTIAASSKIEIEARSGNASGSDIVLCKNIDGTEAVSGDKNEVSNSNDTVTYANVPAGTYYLGAYPATGNHNRGVRIISITVTAI